jgi:hypothetical protein
MQITQIEDLAPDGSLFLRDWIRCVDDIKITVGILFAKLNG